MVNETLITTKNDSLSMLKKLLEQGIDVNIKDTNKRTLLHHAASNSDYDVAKCLLENGADILISNDKSNTALHIAIANKDTAMVLIILNNVTRDKLRKLLDMKVKNTNNTALHLAAMSNCYMNVSVLLKYGANFQIKNSAGKKPIDLTSRNELRELLQLIDTIFKKAKVGDVRLIDEFVNLNSDVYNSIFNCRNNEGYTIMQVLIVNEHYKLVTDLLICRCGGPTEGFNLFDDPNRKKEIESLIAITRDFRNFWCQKRETIMTMSSGLRSGGPQQFKIITGHAGRLACEALEKAHEVFLAYRKFEGKKKTLTTNPAMKNLEEVLEVLGFDPEQLFVIVGEDASYYKKIPSKFKDNIGWLINLLNCIVDASLMLLLRCIYTVQIFDAVKSNDIDEVKKLLEKGGSVDGVDRQHRTALSYAVEQGNKKIIRFLLQSGAEVACDGVTSPIFLAIDNGNVKILKLLLDNVDAGEMVDFIDLRDISGGTALHKAAEEGRLDFVKTLLRFGAAYWIFDGNGQTPLDLSTNDEVSTFLKIVDECFHDAKEADIELVHKLKAMQTDEFMAIAGAKNHDGHTLAIVAAKANAKNIATIILRMIKEAKQEEK